ncbi:hypothetical protein KBC75_03115 [Candidatus Shapirobacteria bacterium]|nr:hypothetical protein [Candidatus Shapirobacteria bacterium]
MVNHPIDNYELHHIILPVRLLTRNLYQIDGQPFLDVVVPLQRKNITDMSPIIATSPLSSSIFLTCRAVLERPVRFGKLADDRFTVSQVYTNRTPVDFDIEWTVTDLAATGLITTASPTWRANLLVLKQVR